MNSRMREGDGADVSAEGDGLANRGLPSLIIKVESLLGDRGRPPETRADEIRKVCLAYMTAPDAERGEISAAAESFCRAVTGKGNSTTSPLSEGGREVSQLLEAEKTIGRIGKKFFGVAKNGRDFFKRITTK